MNSPSHSDHDQIFQTALDAYNHHRSHEAIGLLETLINRSSAVKEDYYESLAVILFNENKYSESITVSKKLKQELNHTILT